MEVHAVGEAAGQLRHPRPVGADDHRAHRSGNGHAGSVREAGPFALEARGTRPQCAQEADGLGHPRPPAIGRLVDEMEHGHLGGVRRRTARAGAQPEHEPSSGQRLQRRRRHRDVDGVAGGHVHHQRTQANARRRGGDRPQDRPHVEAAVSAENGAREVVVAPDRREAGGLGRLRGFDQNRRVDSRWVERDADLHVALPTTMVLERSTLRAGAIRSDEEDPCPSSSPV